MRLLILFLLFVAVSVAKGQEAPKNFSITMTMTTGPHSGQFLSIITKKGNNLKLYYSFRDSVSRGFYKDKRLREILDRPSIPGDKSKYMAIQKLQHQYSYYSTDSLMLKVKNYKSFVALLETVVTTPVDVLENLKGNRKFNVLDGASYDFIVESMNGTKYFFVHEPDPVAHPLLYQLDKQILEIYRSKRQNNFLDKMNTISW